jgi:hypothetical protein
MFFPSMDSKLGKSHFLVHCSEAKSKTSEAQYKKKLKQWNFLKSIIRSSTKVDIAMTRASVQEQRFQKEGEETVCSNLKPETPPQ